MKEIVILMEVEEEEHLTTDNGMQLILIGQ
jgi:hypothetical protein